MNAALNSSRPELTVSVKDSPVDVASAEDRRDAARYRALLRHASGSFDLDTYADRLIARDALGPSITSESK